MSRVSGLIVALPIVLVGVMAGAGTSASAPSVSSPRPHDGRWHYTNTGYGGVKTASMKVTGHGHKISQLTVTPTTSETTCPGPKITVAKSFSISRPKGGETWEAGSRPYTKLIPVTLHAGGKTLKGKLQVTFSGPTVGSGDLRYRNRCDLILGLKK
jgi:hypothetical protein